MGKSSSVSCFKFVGCGDPDSVDRDDVPAAETNDSSDKRKWSFRKRSARNRVLSNSAILQTSIGTNTGFESGPADFQKQDSCTNVDSNVSMAVSPVKEESAAEEESATDIPPDELTVITIQTAFRGFLARRALAKHKDIIMLQAAIRGHIVRKLAVGSLRCVLAIVKMQVLIRERRARLLLESSSSDGNDEKLDKRSPKGMVNLGSRPLETYASIEELLRKSFARQLLESYPRSKTINIKCEPLKSDSAWKWMERWMSISSIGCNNSPFPQNIVEKPGEKCSEQPEHQLEDGISHKDSCQSREMESSNEESVVPSEVGSAISHSMHSFVSNKSIERPNPVTSCIETQCVDMSDSLSEQSEHQLEDGISHEDSIPSRETESKNEESVVPSEGVSAISHGVHSFESNNDIERPCSMTICVENECDDMSDSVPDHTKESSNASKTEPNSYTNPAEMCEQDTDSVDSHPGKSETTGKNVPFGTRKASNPAFIAAKSKFQELSLAGNSAKPVGLSKQDASLEPSADAVSTVMSVRTRETLPATASLLPAPSQVEVADPETVTELPISSSLDLPGGPVTDNFSSEKEKEVLEDKDEYRKNHISSFADTNVKSPILDGPVIDASSVEKETAVLEDKDEYISSSLDFPGGPVTDNFSSEKEKEVLEDKDEYRKNYISSFADTNVKSPILDGPVIDASSVEKETAVLEDKDEYIKNHVSSVVDAKVESPILEKDLSCSEPFLEERDDNIGHDACSAIAVDSSQAYENKESVVVKIQMQTDTSREPSTLSPAASPRSRMTVTDCQETPSSQVSVNPKKSSGRSVANHKRKSLSSGKGYHSDSKHDFGAKTDSEQASKENKTGKRRNSLGSARTDNGNQEPRDSSSSNPLPSYMQATESAKAKAIASNSPRSSPDVLDKDFHIKKRHSLPGGNTKHGSSCAQQSTSQALQDAKSNGVHSPQDRKWRR